MPLDPLWRVTRIADLANWTITATDAADAIAKIMAKFVKQGLPPGVPEDYTAELVH